jgi:hypothetical protein
VSFFNFASVILQLFSHVCSHHDADPFSRGRHMRGRVLLVAAHAQNAPEKERHERDPEPRRCALFCAAEHVLVSACLYVVMVLSKNNGAHMYVYTWRDIYRLAHVSSRDKSARV